MTMISLAYGAAHCRDESFKMIALLCGVGLLASFSLMTSGVDFTTAWL